MPSLARGKRKLAESFFKNLLLILEDYLHHSISFAEFYYENKFVKQIGGFSSITAIFYLLALLYNTLLKENTKVTEEYIFYGSVVFLVIVCLY